MTFFNAGVSEQMVLKDMSESGWAATLQRAISESNAKGITICNVQKLSGKLNRRL